MDTDSLPSAPVFIVFLLLFSYLTLAERSGADGGFPHREGRPLRGGAYAIGLLKYLCLIASSISALALATAIAGSGWATLTALGVVLMVLLLVIDRATALFATRYPQVAARLSRPLLRNPDRRPTNGRPAGDGNGLYANGGFGTLEEGPLDSPTESDGPPITEEELISLDQRDREMLRSILQLDVSTVREIMVPRLDIVAISADSSLDQVVGTMIRSGHSRLPVYDETIDRVAGIIHVRDVLGLTSQGKTSGPWRDLVRPAFFVPESKRLDDLLEELQGKGLQMAIVVDEYGGTEGLVTMEDLLEEIVGEIEDEFSRTQEPQVVRLADGAALVDAAVTTADVEELFGTQIDSPDVDTVGGYVYRTLGKIPQQGDFVETDHLRIEVVAIMGRRLRKLRINQVKEDAAFPLE